MKRPVARLKKALYGHPDSGSFWEAHCNKHVRSVGFVPCGAEWPSVFRHPLLDLFLVVYVDDFKLAGPSKSLKKGWALLRQGLQIDPETPLGLFLGCTIRKGTITLPDGKKATSVEYDMEDYLKNCVQKYIDVTGGGGGRD
jgi:hypothetical protein